MGPAKGRKERQMAVDSATSVPEDVELEILRLPGAMGSAIRFPRVACGTRSGGVH